MASEWTTVSHKRQPRTCMTRTRADAIQTKWNIRGLSDALMSPQSKKLQAEGWTLDRVIEPTKDEQEEAAVDSYVENLGNTPNEYTWMPVGNKFRDIVIFVRPR